MPKTIPLGMKLFLGIFILVGAIAFGAGVYNFIRGVRCVQWPTTDGVVEAAAVREHSGTDDHGDTFSAEIAYHYSVAGIHYSATRRAFGAMSSSSAYAQAIVRRYPAGRTVPVYYAPNDPQNAVLETGVHGGTWICLGVGTLFMLMGMMFLQLAGRTGSAGRPASATPPSVNTQAPPVLMGVIFALLGSFAFFGNPSDGTPRWVVWLAGGMFVFVGLFLITLRFENKLWSNLFKWAGGLAFMMIFHWIAFAPGERPGTSTTPFSHHPGVNVKTPFAMFTVLMDLCLLAVAVGWFKKKGRGR